MSNKLQNFTQPHIEAVALRKRAEKQASFMESSELFAQTPEKIQQMLHELRVHQIELEMQNEELRTAHEVIEAVRARYFDLYDQAPVAIAFCLSWGWLWRPTSPPLRYWARPATCWSSSRSPASSLEKIRISIT
ncbi:hypothetical protein [Nitrincola sp. A-D6]|uniref:hypothetical protein n=1 Tax=Nitrincola sp. A-D6 TaxID=1545442 RepID=UPI0013629130|nr:hypothetical protein [Nitrincola sp. A-D6]